MADDKMRNDDRENMGGQQKGQGDYGRSQQSPGRNKQDDDVRTGQRDAGQQGEQRRVKDDLDASEESDMGQGGRNR